MEYVFFKKLFTTMALVLFQVNVGHGADFICKTTFFAEGSLQTVKEQFSPYDKVYLQSLCKQLLPGDYEITAVWHTPSGQVQRQDIHSFSLPALADYNAFFWMKLHKKNSLQEASSNSTFSDKYYGVWTVKLYLNEQSISKNTFTIQ